MKHITVDIPDDKYTFFLELVNQLGFGTKMKKRKTVAGEHAIENSLKQGFRELELVKENKLETRSLKDFLNEI